jgi:tungstate transport system ATP-binding protein
MSLTLNIERISKSYDARHVLRDCSVSFELSGIHVVLGPNGCGKSTFLRICALLERPDTGRVLFTSGGEPLESSIELKRRITLVLPSVGVFNTSVYRNVAYGLKIRGVKGVEVEERTDRVLEYVGLIQKKNHNALTLSSGEKQRLGIARAVVIEPEILFLDEPAVYVDQENTEIIEKIILDLKQLRKTTVVITTHHVEQGKRLADRTLVMRDGMIVERDQMQ